MNKKRTCRLRIRQEILSNRSPWERTQLILQTRIKTRERVRRFRLNESNDKRLLRREKDRNYKKLKRMQKRSSHSDNNRLNMTDACLWSNSGNEPIESVFIFNFDPNSKYKHV